MITRMHITCFLITGMLCAATGSFAQGVGIGTATPDGSAQLDISATNKGILVPRLTAAQRNAIGNPTRGLLVFQTDGTPGFYYYGGGAWINLTNGLQPDAQGLTISASYAVVSTLAGNTSHGSTDGTGTAATFSTTYAVVTDRSGNVYVADYNNNKIRKITPAGVVTTLAGSGTAGSADGTGTAATFFNPAGIAIDAAGNLYVADYGNNKIRMLTPAGVVTTLAGSGTAGSTDGSALTASFNGPMGIAVDNSGGDVFITDFTGNLVRRIKPGGYVSTWAGNGTKASIDGDNTNASFNNPAGITADAAGNLYVADYGGHRIRKINGSGTVTTLAGSNGGSLDGTATRARFSNPFGIAIDAAGNLYIGDYGNNEIRKITPDAIVSTLAGDWSAIISTSVVNGTGTAALFFGPRGVAVDNSGNLYVADSRYGVIRKIIIQ